MSPFDLLSALFWNIKTGICKRHEVVSIKI